MAMGCGELSPSDESWLPSDNCPFGRYIRYAQKFYPWNINYMSMENFLHASNSTQNAPFSDGNSA
jgi:hypothetical protein